MSPAERVWAEVTAARDAALAAGWVSPLERLRTPVVVTGEGYAPVPSGGDGVPWEEGS